jgi:hypothetical protein
MLHKNLLLALAALLLAQHAKAGPPAIAGIGYAADTGTNLIDANTFVARRDFVLDALGAGRLRMTIPGLPDTVILRDFHIENDAHGDYLFALDTGIALNGIYFSPADVIRFNGSDFTREFDSAAAGVPPGVHCDGVARWGDTGKLLLSFDRTFTAGGITILPADVIVFSGGAFGKKVLDAHARGLPANLNVDAIDTFRTKDYLLVSFDSGGKVGGITFTAADVLQLHVTTGAWSKRYTMLDFSDRWSRANLDGLLAINNDTIFQDDFE